MTFITLSPRVQMIAAGVAVAGMAWVFMATGTAVVQMIENARDTVKTQQMKSRYSQLLEDARANEDHAMALLNRKASEFEVQSAEFERRHETLKRLLAIATHTGDERPAIGEVLMRPMIEDPAPRERRLASAPARNDELELIKSDQDQLLADIEEGRTERAEELRSVIAMTGLQPEVLEIQARGATGGPFIAVSESATFAPEVDYEDPFLRRALRVASRLDEVSVLEKIVRDMPLGMPVGPEARRTSGFGTRVDPFTGKLARHTGLDFGGPNLTPIYAAAPGTVSFVGWKSAYGRVVEIDHGPGFKTRYAHLARFFVEEGDEVALGDRIAGMGSSGRSTGTHLHYEVWFGKRRYDPSDFLGAGRHVYESGQGQGG